MDKENEKKLIDEYSERLFEEFCDADADITDPRVSNEMLSEIKLRSGIRKEKSRPVFRIVRVLRYAAILLLPVVSAISVYGIMVSLRLSRRTPDSGRAQSCRTEQKYG